MFLSLVPYSFHFFSKILCYSASVSFSSYLANGSNMAMPANEIFFTE